MSQNSRNKRSAKQTDDSASKKQKPAADDVPEGVAKYYDIASTGMEEAFDANAAERLNEALDTSKGAEFSIGLLKKGVNMSQENWRDHIVKVLHIKDLSAKDMDQALELKAPVDDHSECLMQSIGAIHDDEESEADAKAAIVDMAGSLYKRALDDQDFKPTTFNGAEGFEDFIVGFLPQDFRRINRRDRKAWVDALECKHPLAIAHDEIILEQERETAKEAEDLKLQEASKAKDRADKNARRVANAIRRMEEKKARKAPTLVTVDADSDDKISDGDDNSDDTADTPTNDRASDKVRGGSYKARADSYQKIIDGASKNGRGKAGPSVGAATVNPPPPTPKKTPLKTIPKYAHRNQVPSHIRLRHMKPLEVMDLVQRNVNKIVISCVDTNFDRKGVTAKLRALNVDIGDWIQHNKPTVSKHRRYS